MAVNYQLPKPVAGTKRNQAPTETALMGDIVDTLADIDTRLIGKAAISDPFGFGIPFTIDPRNASGSNALTANQTTYSRVTGGKTISKIAIRVQTASGNIAVAVYDTVGSAETAKPNARQATSGAVACPATGRAEISLGVAVAQSPGWFYALSADNATATFQRAANGVAGLSDGFQWAEGVHPPPATATAGLASALSHIMTGVA